MSHDLVFWRTERDLDPLDVYQGINRGASVPGLAELNLSAIESEIISAFRLWRVEARISPDTLQTILIGPDDQAGLDITYTPQSVSVSCYGTGPAEWNSIIGVMVRLDLPLFDPQTSERFD